MNTTHCSKQANYIIKYKTPSEDEKNFSKSRRRLLNEVTLTPSYSSYTLAVVKPTTLTVFVKGLRH